MALDEANAAVVATATKAGTPPMHTLDPVAARAFVGNYGPGPEVRRTSGHTVESSDGATFSVRLHVPADNPAGVLVYLHGGGWVKGSMDQADALGRVLASRTGMAVLLVDYRLAPENPFPAGLEDAWASVQWIAAQAENLGLPGGLPIVVAGDSAGANLAAVVALRARDHLAPAIAAQVLVYPVTDYNPDTASYLDPENQLLLDRAGMLWFWSHYIADPALRLDPEASPLRAPLAGVAPAIVLTAEHDVLRDEGEAYAEALLAAGVPVSQRRFAGQMHGFFSMIGVVSGHEEGVRFVAEELDRLLSIERTCPSGPGVRTATSPSRG
jgi:acetyl esterase